ncbi:MAG: DUF1549 domain-containing protein, partial [Planctomycetes bacterium]|nr:DUF1549 domain-containing protein [Planctomycetota bacterium]
MRHVRWAFSECLRRTEYRTLILVLFFVGLVGVAYFRTDRSRSSPEVALTTQSWDSTTTSTIWNSTNQSAVNEVESSSDADVRLLCETCCVNPSTETDDSQLALNSTVEPIVESKGDPRAVVIDNSLELSIDFERDIQPILVNRCYRCHGPDRQEQEIRFDVRATVFMPSKSGTIPVVSGNLSRSELISRVESSDDSLRMPPDEEPLSDIEISKLKSWISTGANWPEHFQHWSFRTPRQPIVPVPMNSGRSRNPIDEFIQHRLESHNVEVNQEAGKETLIRRLSLDLIGLPPSLIDVDEFV